MATILINNIIRQLNEIQNGSLWFDQCLKGKLEPLTEEQAFMRPIPDVHSVSDTRHEL